MADQELAQRSTEVCTIETNQNRMQTSFHFQLPMASADARTTHHASPPQDDDSSFSTRSATSTVAPELMAVDDLSITDSSLSLDDETMEPFESIDKLLDCWSFTKLLAY